MSQSPLLGPATWLLDRLLPPACFACAAATDRQGTLCPACYAGLARNPAPACRACAAPVDPLEAPLCRHCRADPPPQERSYALFAYDEAAKALLLPLKHAGRFDLGRWIGRMMAGLLPPEPDPATLVVPVPIAWGRLQRRGYNQALLLARAVAAAQGLACLPDALQQSGAATQKGLSRAARRRRLNGAIQVRPGLQPRLAGRSVILVDDVMTTGATLAAAAGALRRAGAETVVALVAARVPPPEETLPEETPGAEC